MMLGIFHKPLGLSNDWELPFSIAGAACWISLLVLQRCRRNARLAVGLPPTEKPPSKRSFWFALMLIVPASLSGPLWLPYTGLILLVSTLVITSVVSSVLAMVIFVFSWRYWNKKV
jgi:hypothetical protein